MEWQWFIMDPAYLAYLSSISHDFVSDTSSRLVICSCDGATPTANCQVNMYRDLRGQDPKYLDFDGTTSEAVISASC